VSFEWACGMAAHTLHGSFFGSANGSFGHGSCCLGFASAIMASDQVANSAATAWARMSCRKCGEGGRRTEGGRRGCGTEGLLCEADIIASGPGDARANLGDLGLRRGNVAESIVGSRTRVK
jgi:hypothetical protein